MKLCQQEMYNNSIFHRLVPGFMMQGGKISSDCIYEKPFPNEIVEDLKFDEEFKLGMANTGPNSNTTEVFFSIHPVVLRHICICKSSE
jgi:cyclophilin family peptidyl-prolyl cis-trans isomerase